MPNFIYRGLASIEHHLHAGVIHPGDVVDLPEHPGGEFDPVDQEPATPPAVDPAPAPAEPEGA